MLEAERRQRPRQRRLDGNRKRRQRDGGQQRLGRRQRRGRPRRDGGGDAPSGSGGATTGCGSLPLCDDFEAASGTLNTARWTLIPTSNSGTATIDTLGAHGSGPPLKVASMTGCTCATAASSARSVGGPRPFFARFSTALPMGTAAHHRHPQPGRRRTSTRSRTSCGFGSQDAVFHWNTDSDSANIPVSARATRVASASRQHLVLHRADDEPRTAT